jgi:exosortase A
MSAVPPTPTSAGVAPPAQVISWRHALLAIALVELALVALYRDTAWAMMGIWWRSETFNHAFLVPPIVLWLIWERRHALARAEPRPARWLTVPLAGLAFIWLLGELAAVNAVTQLAFTAMLVLAVPLVIGLPAARLIAFPLGFLFFAVPIGEFVMPKLMEWTAAFTVFGLRASGIPVYQEGLHFVIPSGRWSVVEACSGVRYLIASITVGTLYAYLNYQSLKRRLIFVGVAILVPVLANWARAYLIVMLGHLSGNTLAVGVDHLIYGWVFFGVVMAIMFAIGMRWREMEPPLPPLASGTAAAAPGPAETGGQAGRFAAAAGIALAVALAPHAALFALDHGPEAAPPALHAETLARSEWQLVGAALADWQPAFANPAATLNATLARDERRVGVFVAWYSQQGYDRKLISSENMLVKSNDPVWAQTERSTRQIALGETRFAARAGTLRGSAASLGAEPDRLRVLHWYWIGGRIVTSDHLGKLWLALDRLTGRGDDSAAVFVYAPESQPQGADAALADYLAEAGGGIAALLEGARARYDARLK